MDKVIHWLAAVVIVPVSLHAQSATALVAKKKETPAPPTSQVPSTTAPKPPLEDAPLAQRPSRYIAKKSVQTYIDEVSRSFAIHTRTSDPFGLIQDPNHVAKPKPVAKPARAAIAPVVPYSQIVAQIKVTMVIPRENRFMVGSRSFKTGDRFPLSYQGRSFPSEVMEVTAGKITLKHLENGETAVIQLDLLPGMSKEAPPLLRPQAQDPSAPVPLEIAPSSGPSNSN